MQKTLIGALLSLSLIGAACAADGAEVADGSRDARVAAPETTVAPTRVTATTAAPATTVVTVPPSTTTTTVVEEVEPEIIGGPGVEHTVFLESLAPLVAAEQAMHDFEADWDAGMTYSDTFRGWREVKATVTAALDGFAFPTDASAEQLLAGTEYVAAIQGAHDEWQNVTDFIVTYITNYTPEVLILNAYSDAELRLRDAIAAYDVIEALGA